MGAAVWKRRLCRADTTIYPMDFHAHALRRVAHSWISVNLRVAELLAQGLTPSGSASPAIAGRPCVFVNQKARQLIMRNRVSWMD